MCILPSYFLCSLQVNAEKDLNLPVRTAEERELPINLRLMTLFFPQQFANYLKGLETKPEQKTAERPSVLTYQQAVDLLIHH